MKLSLTGEIKKLLDEKSKFTKYKRGQKIKHKRHGTCFYYGETSRGEAIIELYKGKKLVDRLPAKYEDLEVIK